MDDELRALARALEADASAEARIRYARALERAGRESDAVSVLLAAREDATVRSEFLRLISIPPDSGATHFTNVRPLLGEPRIRWMATVPNELEHWVGWSRGLAANPLGVAVPGRGVALLDFESGAVRFEVPGQLVGIAEDVLFVHGSSVLTARDMVTGAVRRETDCESARLFAGGVLLRRGGAIFDAALPSMHRAPRVPAEPLLQCEYRSALVAGELVVAGRELWERTSRKRRGVLPERWLLMLDEQSLVIRDRERHALHATRAGFKLQKKLLPPLRPVALAPSFVVAAEPDDDRARLDLLDAKPRPVAVIRGERVGVALVAGEVIYATIERPTEDFVSPVVDVMLDFEDLAGFHGRPDARAETIALAAWTADGEQLWRIPVASPLPRRIDTLAATPGALLGAGTGGVVFRLDAGD